VISWVLPAAIAAVIVALLWALIVGPNSRGNALGDELRASTAIDEKVVEDNNRLVTLGKQASEHGEHCTDTVHAELIEAAEHITDDLETGHRSLQVASVLGVTDVPAIRPDNLVKPTMPHIDRIRSGPTRRPPLARPGRTAGSAVPAGPRAAAQPAPRVARPPLTLSGPPRGRTPRVPRRAARASGWPAAHGRGRTSGAATRVPTPALLGEVLGLGADLKVAADRLGAHAQRQVEDLVHDDVVLTEGQVRGQGQGVALRAHDPLVAVAVELEPAVPVVGDGTDPQPAVPWAGPRNDEAGEARDLGGVHRRLDPQHRRLRQRFTSDAHGRPFSLPGWRWGRLSRPPARCSRWSPRPWCCV